MLRVKDNQRNIIRHLYKDAYDTTIWSYFQGYIGMAWCNFEESATCARILVGDFCFLAGEPTDTQISEFLNDDLEFKNKKDIIWIPQSQVWEQVLKQAKSYIQLTRYAFHKDSKQFDKHNLQQYSQGLPAGYSFHEIDLELFHQVLQESWSKDFVSNYKSYKEYMSRGIGYVIKKGNEIIAGASSYTYYDGGIEIEIITREDYRRQGLATMVGAKLILKCLEEGCYPNWDAANTNSAATAKKLGYKLDKEYAVFMLRE